MNVSLDREITVQKKAEPGDEGYIEPDSSYGTDKTIWIPLAPMPGSPPIGYRFPANIQDVMPSRMDAEEVSRGVNIATARTRVRMRYRTDITSSMRVVVHGDTDSIWQITTPPASIGGRKEYIEFMIEKFSS